MRLVVFKSGPGITRAELQQRMITRIRGIIELLRSNKMVRQLRCSASE